MTETCKDLPLLQFSLQKAEGLCMIQVSAMMFNEFDLFLVASHHREADSEALDLVYTRDRSDGSGSESDWNRKRNRHSYL